MANTLKGTKAILTRHQNSEPMSLYRAGLKLAFFLPLGIAIADKIQLTFALLDYWVKSAHSHL